LQMSNLLTTLNDPTSGAIVVDLSGITDTENSLNDSINNFEANMSVLRQQLVDQLTQASNALQQLPLMEAQISAELGQMPSTSNNNNQSS